MCGELITNDYVIHTARDLPAGLHLYNEVTGSFTFKIFGDPAELPYWLNLTKLFRAFLYHPATFSQRSTLLFWLVLHPKSPVKFPRSVEFKVLV